jgi:hypothetical protein
MEGVGAISALFAARNEDNSNNVLRRLGALARGETMAELRLIALSECLNDDQLTELKQKLVDFGVTELVDSDDAVDLDDTLSEDQLTDFLDRLEAHDIAADIYLPVEFEGRVGVGEQTFGSVHALAEALEEIREELDIDEPSASDGDDEMDLEMIEEQLSYAWQVFTRAANACIDRQIPLHVIP